MLGELRSLWQEAGSGVLIDLLNRVGGENDPAVALDNWPVLSLAGLCCEAAGGDSSQADSVIAAWGSLYLAAHWIDSIVDGDLPADHLGAKLMLSTACFASAGFFLSQLTPQVTDPETAQAIQEDFYRSVLKASTGQVMDMEAMAVSLDQAWSIVKAKTGEPYALACRSGACLVSKDRQRIAAFGEFGSHLGILIQIDDDIQGLSQAGEVKSDLVLRKSTLPVAYLLDVLPDSERQRVLSLLDRAPSDPSSEEALRREIVASGALIFLAAEAERHHSQAAAALGRAAHPGPAYRKLLAILDQTTAFYRR